MARKAEKIGDIQETWKDYNIKIKDIVVNDVFIQYLSKEATKIPDYRHLSYVNTKHRIFFLYVSLDFLQTSMNGKK